MIFVIEVGGKMLSFVVIINSFTLFAFAILFSYLGTSGTGWLGLMAASSTDKFKYILGSVVLFLEREGRGSGSPLMRTFTSSKLLTRTSPPS